MKGVMNDVTLRQLQVFAKIVEEGSFNQCAKALEISGVAITNHINKLERRLGHKLFHRSPGGIAVLTQEGESDYKTIAGILADLGTLLNHPDHSASLRKLRITADPFIVHCMQKEFSAFAASNPAIAIQYEMEDIACAAIERQLREGTTDIGYFYASDDYFSHDSEFICSMPLALYVGFNHPLADQKKVTMADVLAYSAIETSKNNYLNKLFNRAMEKIGLSGFEVTLQTDNIALFARRLSSDPVFTCMFQQVEVASGGLELEFKAKRLALDFPMPGLQLRQIIRSPLHHEPLIKLAAKQFTASVRV